MPTHLSEPAQALLDTFCDEGCRHVRDVIADIEDGKITAAEHNLSVDEFQGILKELKSIMAVYEKRCN